MPANKTEKIQRTIQIYAIFAVVLIAITITAVAVYPLYSKLRDTEQRGLAFARDTGVLIVDEYVARIKDIAKQISSRTKARLLVQDYDDNKISKHEMTPYLRNILRSALRSSTQLMGITRVNKNGDIMANVGKPIPSDFYPAHMTPSQLKLYGPFTRDKHYFITVVSPIYAPKKKYVGADITLFDISDLQSSIHKKIQHRLGEILVAYIDHHQLNIFSPIDTPWKTILHANNVLVESLITAIDHRDHGVISGPVDGINLFIAFAPIHQSNWGIAVVVKKSALFASIQKALWLILGVIILVTLCFIIGLELCLRPLSGRIIMRTNELEAEIDNSKQELKQANEKLQHIVDYDFLTGIINRRGFTDIVNKEISRSKREERSFAILYIDVNDFKKTNDEKGHEAGDILLKAIAERLTLVMRKEDTVARLGGDEFAIILPGVGDNKMAPLMAKAREIVNLPVSYNNDFIACNISIGSAIYPKDGITIDNLLKQADKAMYIEKKRK
ncbi:MAG: diguanylate cyclase [Coxiellaceae bacterium]|nr:diguanylate cyclase [Coxiellaceae bacterium]